MPSAQDIHGTVFKNGSATLLARVVGADDEAIVQADIDAAEYTAYLLDKTDEDSLVAVAGHSAVEVDPEDLLFDTLQTDALWDVDATGYNFKHVLDVSEAQAFPATGTYLIVFTLDPSAGQPILVRFHAHAI